MRENDSAGQGRSDGTRAAYNDAGDRALVTFLFLLGVGSAVAGLVVDDQRIGTTLVLCFLAGVLIREIYRWASPRGWIDSVRGESPAGQRSFPRIAVQLAVLVLLVFAQRLGSHETVARSTAFALVSGIFYGAYLWWFRIRKSKTLEHGIKHTWS